MRRGSRTHHLDPRMFENVERARQVAAHRVPHHLATDHDAVEGVFVAGHELLEHRLGGGRRRRRQPVAEAGLAVDRGTCSGRRRRPAVWRRTGSRCQRRRPAPPARTQPADCGHRARRQRRTPLRSSAFVRGSSRRRRGRSGDARTRRRRLPPSWTWRFSRMPSGRSTPATRWPTSATAAVRESTSRTSASCRCPRPACSPNRSVGSLLTTGAGAGDVGHGTKRTVAAIAYGATNTTFMAFPGHAGPCWPLARWRSLADRGCRNIHLERTAPGAARDLRQPVTDCESLS